MAHFYATIQGSRGPASRLGTARSGLTATAASWQGAVTVELTHDPATDTDMAVVRLCPWHGAGVDRVLYRGPVGGTPRNLA